MDILNNLSTAHWLILISTSIITGFIGAFSYIRIFYKRERIISDNLKRPIKIFFPSEAKVNNMSMEFNLLSKSGLFNIENPTSDPRGSVGITNHSLVILG
ncbi:MAG: hypothetical protein Q7K55_07165, partial [Candidatus Levybacteria bacterium]|nr:hypothetical protein [Candidatus Levybacteria bacterium]